MGMGGRNLLYSINPANESILKSFEPYSDTILEKALDEARVVGASWRAKTFAQRAQLLQKAAVRLLDHKTQLASVITAEMGKPIPEAEAEVEKCAWNCTYYAESGESFLRDDPRPSSASLSYVQFTPMGTILAIMPWNFPFWQVFRFAAPALLAGNTALLKHASNVPQCALAIEEVFRESGFPAGVFQALLISGSTAGKIIEDPRVAAVTLTGSEDAGSEIAAQAGRALKKTVLELGGSDPFIVLEDADIPSAVETGIRSRYQNAGQSCIAAKRFIVVRSCFEEFKERFVEGVRGLKVGDPMDRSTRVGPLARLDLLHTLEQQVAESIAEGAELSCGGSRIGDRGYFFEPAVLSGVNAGMSAARNEVFGPVAALMPVRDTEEAIQVANDSRYGLGASLWTSDPQRARSITRRIEAGQVFINGMVASDPRLPFGGVKRSGYGRELSDFGIREFVNIQTVWIR
jgi:succinate-semialdehyde dehydrogenase/glutarate-semialdehyde dehydrogenase